MSYTFSVTYNNVVKKVTCESNATVNQLVGKSLEKFKLAPSLNGSLSYRGKVLNGLLPIRLANLVNNAKISLSISSTTSTASVKFVGSIHGESVSKVLKADSSVSLPQLVADFLTAVDKTASLENDSIELSIVGRSVTNKAPEFHSLTVHSLLGSSSNAVIRINIQTTNAIHPVEPTPKLSLAQKEVTKSKNTTSSSISQSQNTTSQKNRTIQLPSDAEQKRAMSRASVQDEQQPDVNEAEQAPVSRSNGEWNLPAEEHKDTLYKPSQAPATYENPVEDYDMTAPQAEKYLKLLKAMQTRAPPKKEHKKPSRYVIRVRFPDRALLDIRLDDPSIKLGQFLKKLDEYVCEVYINAYVLKNGSPPFKKIKFGFQENSVALREHPDFQQEKVLLIWETSKHTNNEPYLKGGIYTKDVGELPTVLLEHHRGELGEDQPESTSKELPQKQGKTSQPTRHHKKGMPKWFRP